VGVIGFTYPGDFLFCAMFPDTVIPQKYGSSRTKTNVLVETLAVMI